MATDGYIESVHQIADGEINAPLGHGTFLSHSIILLFPSVAWIFMFISLSCLPK